jgi:hypothetical protein
VPDAGQDTCAPFAAVPMSFSRLLSSDGLIVFNMMGLALAAGLQDAVVVSMMPFC